MRFEFAKFIDTEKGFNLVEIMIGTAILVGVALGVSQLFTDQQGGMKRVGHEQELQTFHQSLSKVLQDANNCNATLQASYKANSIAPITAIKVCSTCSASDLKTDAGMVTATDYIRVGDWIENKNGVTTAGKGYWLLQNIAIDQPTPGKTGKIIVRITYGVNPELQKNTRSVMKTVVLNLRYSKDDKFLECFNALESSVNNMQNEFCQSLSPTDTSGGILVEWDEATQSCVRRTNVANCGDGMTIEGIRSDGMVKCIPFGKNVNPDSMISPSTPTCTRGKQARLVTIGGKVSTQCI